MRRRWQYLKWLLRTKRLSVLGLAGLILLGCLMFGNRERFVDFCGKIYEQYGVPAAGAVMDSWKPEVWNGGSWSGGGWNGGSWTSKGQNTGASRWGWLVSQPEIVKYLEELPQMPDYGEDPAYERLLASAWEQKIFQENERAGQWSGAESEGDGTANAETASQFVKETINVKPSQTSVIREKLADYDYLMKQFYIVHPTTTADRSLINAENFLSMDLSIAKQPEQPQILIYHTHSQETFADYPQNEHATIVGVGAYLAELLEEKGYQVIHDTTVYDVKEGSLDRNQAYTYALDGISGILQKYPTIEVVLDVHRDGVAEDTHLVTEVNGNPTAQIMFFNGTSQTPDGPIEYLPNPNREANLAFSFQMQLRAEEQYPGFTRKIYLKGLRYNQHVRARTALIEVGAQTNTYAEALNAMEPLADILCRVLDGE